MADKVYVLVIRVDLDCCRCRRGIQEHLCKIQHKERIVAIIYDEKNNVVQVSGPFNPEQLKRKLLCKLPKIIKSIDIIDPSKPKDTEKEKEKEKEKETPKPPPKDENKERFMRCCEEEYEEITKELEKCKKACEEKCKKEFEDRLKRKCKCKCECECKEAKKEPPKKEPEKEPPKKEEPKKEEPKKEEPKKEEPKKPCPPPQPAPPICMWPPHHVKMVCCARPCPCFEAWSSNYRCCSCGVVSWPSGSGSGGGWGGGGGHGSWGRPSQWGCEPGRGPNIVVESSPPCTIM